jgi:hypothetical protein
MSVVTAIERAAQLPLKDAAYFLWMQKYQLDREDLPSPLPAAQPQNLADPEMFRRTVLTAIANVHKERTTAHNGSTFGRLKTAHPEVGDQDLQNAIKAAVKLDVDCTRHFSYSESGLWGDAHRAIEFARKENPDFLESTYEAAKWHMCWAMR